MKITTPAVMCIHNRTSLQSFTIVLQTNGKPDRKPIPCNSASRKEGCVNVNEHFVDIYAENMIISHSGTPQLFLKTTACVIFCTESIEDISNCVTYM